MSGILIFNFSLYYVIKGRPLITIRMIVNHLDQDYHDNLTPVTIMGSPPRRDVLAVGKTNGR